MATFAQQTPYGRPWARSIVWGAALFSTPALAWGQDAPHLLVIEEDPVLAEQLVEIIRARRLKAIVANTGEEGVLLASKFRPQGIILDVTLPEVDGWSVMERLRAEPRTREIPVHFVSGVESKDRGLALGAIGYLMKPATHAELALAVRALAPSRVRRHAQRARRRRQRFGG